MMLIFISGLFAFAGCAPIMKETAIQIEETSQGYRAIIEATRKNLDVIPAIVEDIHEILEDDYREVKQDYELLYNEIYPLIDKIETDGDLSNREIGKLVGLLKELAGYIAEDATPRAIELFGNISRLVAAL